MPSFLASFLRGVAVLSISLMSPGSGQELRANGVVQRHAAPSAQARRRSGRDVDAAASVLTTVARHDSLTAKEQKENPRAMQQSFSFSPVVNSTKSLGTRSFFLVRVSALDSTPHPFTLRQWVRTHFRTHYRHHGGQDPGDLAELIPATSFKTVVEGCSFGKLRVVCRGAIDVTLDRPINTYGRFSEFVNEAAPKVEAILGYKVDDLADHIVYCSPPDGPFFYGVGVQDGNRVNVHSKFCLSLSVLMHEWGHNLNLYHSGTPNGDEYGDMTGMMGAAAIDADGPKKCFNGFKHYQLRWFEDRHLVLHDFTEPQRISLAAFCDYDKTGPEHAVIVNVGDLFYLQYNRAKGINEGTLEEMRDKVTVTHNDKYMSVLDQGLSVGDTFVCVHGNCRALFVSVCARVDAAGPDEPDIMEIAIGYDKNWC